MKDEVIQRKQRKDPPIFIREFPWLLLSIQAILVVAGMLILIAYALSRNNKPSVQLETTTILVTEDYIRYHKFRPIENIADNRISSEIEEETNGFSNAAIYTDHEQCTDIAKNILKRGGNTVDAAAAAILCLAAVHPHRGGLGGGLMATFQSSKGCRTVNARETAPALSTLQTFAKNPDEMAVGPKSIGIPGFIAGLSRLMSNFGSGTMSWQQITIPTIELCRNGFILDKTLASALQEYKSMILTSSAKNVFVNDITRNVWLEGDKINCTQLAETLEELVEYEDVADYFYRGRIGEVLVEEIQDAGGLISPTDMDDFECEVAEGRSVSLDPKKFICGHGPPSMFAVIQLGARVAYYSNSSLDIVVPLALKEMRKIGDPMYNSQRRTEQLFLWDTVKDFVAKVEAGERSAPVSEEIVTLSNVLIMDSSGDTIALSSSLGDPFGGKIYSELGFFLNNAIASFNAPRGSPLTSTESESANSLQPGKSPRSQLSPIIGYNNGKVSFVLSGSRASVDINTLTKLFNNNSNLSYGIPVLLREMDKMQAIYEEDSCPQCGNGI